MLDWFDELYDQFQDTDEILALKVNEDQQHMLRVIKELPASTSKLNVSQAKEPFLLKTFWDTLPDEFDAKQFKSIAQTIGLSIPTAERYIRGWHGTRIEKISRGQYRKKS